MDKESFTQTRAETIADGVKTVGTAGAIRKLIKDGIGLLIITPLMLLLISWGIPAWFCILIIALMAAFVIMDVITIRKTAQVNLDQLYEPEVLQINLDADESVLMWIPGVMRAWKTRSYAVLGTGKVLTPENTLLITNKGVWALTVPLPGADKVVSGTDIGKWQFLTAWKDIETKLNEMLSQNTLYETLRACRAKRIGYREQFKLVRYSDLTQGITIKTKNKETFTYSIRDKETYLKAQSFLPAVN